MKNVSVPAVMRLPACITLIPGFSYYVAHSPLWLAFPVHHANSTFFYANALYQRSAVVHLPSAFCYDLGTNLEYESYAPTVIHAPIWY